jgi:CRISPR/Cas system-associated endoribonuclease Cas2
LNPTILASAVNRWKGLSPLFYSPEGAYEVMATYLISYDLDKPGTQNYQRLEARLRDLKATRVLYSQWILQFAANAASLEHDFKQYIDPSTDSFLVVEINRNVSWNRLRVSDDEFKAILPR